jgi:HK97 family phage major capsid protein
VETEGLEDSPEQEERQMRKKKVRDDKGAVIEVPEDDPRAEIVERSVGVEVLDREEERKAVRDGEIERAETIRALCEMNRLPSTKADEFIRSGESVAVITRGILKERESKGSLGPASEALDALSEKDRRQWSFIRAMRLGAGIAAREKGDDADDDFRRVKFDGLEADVHRELAKELPANTERRGGILIPMDLRSREERLEAAFQKRTMAAKTATLGAESVFDRPGEFIELLRSNAAVAQMGARFLTGLSGPVGFVKQTGGITVYWVGESPGADVTDSDLTLGIVTMAPKTLQASSGYTRQLLMQSSVEVEAMTRTEFAEAHSRAIDKAALHGKGAAGEPLGIYLSPGVGSQAFGGPPTWDLAVDTITKVAVANAMRGSLGWITTPGLAGKMKKTPEHATMFGASWLWRGPLEMGSVADYPATSTTQASSTMSTNEETGGTSHAIVFGNWAEVLFGLYNSMEIVVDPYRLKKRGIIEVTSFQMADLILRHGESFAKGTGAATA